MTDPQTEQAYNKAILDFHTQLMSILALPEPTAPAAKSSTLYPPDQPPDIVVYLGEARQDHFAYARAQLPARTFVFWLYPPCDVTVEQALMTAFPAPARNLFCRLEPMSFHTDKLALLLSILKNQRITLWAAPQIRERFADGVRSVNDTIAAALESAETDTFRGLIRLRCSIHNLPSILGQASRRWRRVPSGTDAIVCGAGPSLTQQLGRIRDAASRAVIIAVGHAAPTLCRAGIIPHIIVEGDSQAYQNWPPDFAPASILAATTEVSPAIARRFPSVVWNYGNSMAFNQMLGRWGVELTSVRLNRTITVPALETARWLGCRRIALVGQDLCVSDTGRLHAEGEALDDVDPLTEAPGNEGVTVKATSDLNGLRDALQAYLAVLSRAGEVAAPGSEIYNCTEGGARIQGARRLALDVFCADLKGTVDPSALVEKREAMPAVDLNSLADAFKRYLHITAEIADCCKRLKRDVEAYPVPMDKVRKQQLQLQQWIAADEAAKREESLAAWLLPVFEFTDAVMSAESGAISGNPDPAQQLTFLQARYSFLHDLCTDIKEDFTQLGKSSANVALGRSPFVFSAFRRYALSRIRAGNRDLADWLAAPPAAEAAREFSIFWINQLIPWVRVRLASGDWRTLSGFADMEASARKELAAVFDSAPFDPKRNGLIMVAPGNWAHVLEWARRYPGASLIVVDPWPELLSVLMDRGCFLHSLPPDLLIVAAKPGMKDWQALVQKRIHVWRERSLTPVMLVHPRLTDEPEIQALAGALKF